jgi:hypothetical protein
MASSAGLAVLYWQSNAIHRRSQSRYCLASTNNHSFCGSPDTRISSDEGGLVTDIIKSFEKHGYKVAVFRCSGSGTPRNSDVMLSPVGLRRTKSGVISSGKKTCPKHQPCE